MDDLIVIYTDMLLKADDAKRIRDSIVNQKEEGGVVIVPNGFKVAYAGKNIELRIEMENAENG